MNNVALIGTISNDIEKNENEEKTTYRIVLKISHKIDEGKFEDDFIPIQLMSSIGDNVFEYCQKGDLIGIKGKIQCKGNNEIQIIAERATFLSTNKELLNQN